MLISSRVNRRLASHCHCFVNPRLPPHPVPSRLFWAIAGIVAFAVGQYRGAASLADVILGMLFCLGVSVTVTDGIKLMVGRPRPNYAALRALVEFGGKGMSSFKVRCSRRSTLDGWSFYCTCENCVSLFASHAVLLAGDLSVGPVFVDVGGKVGPKKKYHQLLCQATAVSGVSSSGRLSNLHLSRLSVTSAARVVGC